MNKSGFYKIWKYDLFVVEIGINYIEITQRSYYLN